jgi:hypothetical protein
MMTKARQSLNPRLSEAQPAGVEHLEPDVGVTIPQGTSRPFVFKAAKHVPPFPHRQATPFQFGDEQPLMVFRVGGDDIQFYVAFPGFDACPTLCLPDITFGAVAHFEEALKDVGDRAFPGAQKHFDRKRP